MAGLSGFLGEQAPGFWRKLRIFLWKTVFQEQPHISFLTVNWRQWRAEAYRLWGEAGTPVCANNLEVRAAAVADTLAVTSCSVSAELALISPDGRQEGLWSCTHLPLKERSKSFSKSFTDPETGSRVAVVVPYSAAVKPKEANGGTKAGVFP